MPRASSRSSCEAQLELVDPRVDERGRLRVVRETPAAEVEAEEEGDQPRLRAVVEVALEPSPLGVACLDDPLARGAQLPKVGSQLGIQALVLEQQGGRRAGRADGLPVLGERRVVDDRRDPPPVALDLRRGPHGRLDGGALFVDIALLLRDPERDLQRGIPERGRQEAAQVPGVGQVGEAGQQAPHAARLREIGTHETGEERERHHGERHERERVQRLGAGRRVGEHECQRHGAGAEQRSQAAALGRAGRAPALDQEPDGQQAQDHQHHRAGRQQRPAELLVRLDEQQVLRAVGAAVDEVAGGAEQHRREWRQRHEDVGGDHERPLRSGRQPPGREAEQHVRQDGAPHGAEQDPGGEEQAVVRGREAAEEPREAEEDHQVPEPRLRTAPPRVHPGADEAPPDHRPEHRPYPVREVVAAQDEHGVRESGQQRQGCDDHARILRLSPPSPRDVRAYRSSAAAQHPATQSFSNRPSGSSSARAAWKASHSG